MHKAIKFDNVAIVYVKGNAYRIHFWYMSKDDMIDVMNDFNLNEKMCVPYFLIIYENWVMQLIIEETKTWY